MAQTSDDVTGEQVPAEPPRRGRFGLDLRPLRGSRDFRAIFLAGLVGTIGAQGTYVVIPYQMKQLTGSLLDVGLLGAVEIVPLIVFGLLGGSLADTVDKRTLILWTELAMLCGTLALLVNALSGHPSPLVLYAVAVVFASADGLQRPSLDALVPRVVAHDQLAGASSLSVFKWTFGSIIGPIAGGTLAVAIGPGAWYAVDAATFACTLACYLTLASAPAGVPAGDQSPGPGLRSVFEGIGYAVSRKDLLGTYLVDFTAMLFAFPVALFPFLAARYHETFALGFLYASLPLGALAASLTSRWTERVRRPWQGHRGRCVLLGERHRGVRAQQVALVRRRRPRRRGRCRRHERHLPHDDVERVDPRRGSGPDGGHRAAQLLDGT